MKMFMILAAVFVAILIGSGIDIMMGMRLQDHYALWQIITHDVWAMMVGAFYLALLQLKH